MAVAGPGGDFGPGSACVDLY